MDYNILTISQLNRYLKAIVDENTVLKEIFIRGEISNFVKHYKSGHCYFTLKDKTAAIRAVMFHSYASYLRFLPENGMSVILRAQVSVYEKDGTCQLIVYDMQPDGIGALHIAFEQLKQRLEQKGIFAQEHKKAIPSMPKNIGIITSSGAAALQDILNILSRRYPLGKVLLYPAYVQGEKAVPSIIDGIEYFNCQNNCDVIIIARGGGSLEELWPFNNEALAIKIYQSKIPIISAVGHETDFTVCDFVADLRAPTPSAAAELVAVDVGTIKKHLLQQYSFIRNQMIYQIDRKEQLLKKYQDKKMFIYPTFLWNQNRQRMNYLIKSIEKNVQDLIVKKQQQLLFMADKIENISPIHLLKKGFSITMKENQVIGCVDQLEIGDTIATQLSDGIVYSIVKKKNSKGCEADEEV